MNKTVLAVVAHPDDEVLGCGGALARHVADGDDVYVVYLTNGVGARSSEVADLTDRKIATEKANKIIGITESYYLEFPDNQMDSIPLLEVVKAVEALVDNVVPDIIYTHYFGDLNIDHRITYQAVITACRPMPKTSVREIYAFEIVSSTDWGVGLFPTFSPNYYVSIEDVLQKKIDALNAYEIEMRAPPHSRSIDHIKSLAIHRGHSVGLAYAEAYVLIRFINDHATSI